MSIATIIGILAIGILIGAIIANIVAKPKYVGNLVVDQSDPDGPYIFLEIQDRDALSDAVRMKKNVMLRAITKNYISQD